jgi:uncharacterized protein (DUF1778 family)
MKTRRVGLTAELPEEWIEVLSNATTSGDRDQLKLSERDSLRVQDLLKNPPAPTDRLIRAAKTHARKTKPDGAEE